MRHASTTTSTRCFSPSMLGFICSFVAACSAADESSPPSDDDTGSPPPISRGAALDAHMHVMSQPLMDLITGGGTAAEGAADVIERLDEARVEKAVLLSYGYLREFPSAELARAENDYAAAQAALHPDRLIGFCGIDPLRGGALAEIDRCADELDMQGLKLHLANALLDTRLPEHVDALAAVFDRASETGLPILMHSGSPLGLPLDSDAFFNLGALIAERPELRLLLAHCTNDADRSEMEVWLSGLDNGLFNRDTLFVDTSSCLKFYADAPQAQKELIVWRLRKWGIENVLFGSDYDWLDPVETPMEALATLKSYPFSEEELAILLNNDGRAWLHGK